MLSKSEDSSEHVSISWLWEFLVVDHLVLDSDKDLLERVSRVPVREHVELGDLNYSVLLVNAWQVDLGVEHDGWWLSWVVVSAGDGEHVDTVIKV